MKYRYSRRQEKREALITAILEYVYREGAATISQIASGVGRSKSPALRAVLADLCDDGRLTVNRQPYKSTGILWFACGDYWRKCRNLQSEMFPNSGGEYEDTLAGWEIVAESSFIAQCGVK